MNNMAVSDVLNRRVRALPDEEEGEEFSDLSGSENAENASDSETGSGEESGGEDGGDVSEEGSEEEGEGELEASDANEDEDVRSSLNNVSFGALVKAQASLGDGGDRGRKRKRSDSTSKEDKKGFAIEEIRARIRDAREKRRREESGGGNKDEDKEKGDKEGKGPKRISRSSKHAPTVQSSKYAVSRKRTVVEPLNVAKARDPRFDPVVLNSGNGKDHNSIAASAAEAARRNYAFLNEYRESELAELREQLKKTKKGSAEQEELKGKIRSMTDRQRAFEDKQREREIRSQHRKRERELIREGKKSKPYFLKDKDVKREMLVQKFEGMRGKEKRRALERRRKKVAGKEKKDMPWGRREVGGGENQGRRR